MAFDLPAGLDYSFGADMSEEDVVHEVQFGDNYSARSVSTAQLPRQIWRVSWTQITYAEKESLMTVFRQSRGVFGVNFTPPQAGAAIVCVVVQPSYKHVGYNNWDVSATFRQIFDEE
jgi:phage-related protein